MLTDAWQQDIHIRLINKDPTAPAELAERIIPSLLKTLQSEYPGLDEDQVTDAANDTIIDYIKSPEKFNPEYKSLKGYLSMSAKKDLLNIIAKERRKKIREISSDAVELLKSGGNNMQEPRDPVQDIINKTYRNEIAELFNTEADLKMVELILDGERSTEAFAQVLKIQSLPPSEQRREVKKNKDRIKKRLRRYGKDIKRNE